MTNNHKGDWQFNNGAEVSICSDLKAFLLYLVERKETVVLLQAVTESLIAAACLKEGR